MQYDDVIVGAGSAGAALAARLSEDRRRMVALLEAGPDYAGVEATPADLQNAWRMSLRKHDWGFAAEAVPGRTIPYPRGRVTGGSSAVNATIALRGVPADYDQWAALGNDGWHWASVPRTSAGSKTILRARKSCTGAAAPWPSAAGGETS